MQSGLACRLLSRERSVEDRPRREDADRESDTFILFHRTIASSAVAADTGRIEVVDCGLEVDDDPGARSVGQVEDLVDLLTVGDIPSSASMVCASLTASALRSVVP
jgi:hypothetical protein